MSRCHEMLPSEHWRLDRSDSTMAPSRRRMLSIDKARSVRRCATFRRMSRTSWRSTSDNAMPSPNGPSSWSRTPSRPNRSAAGLNPPSSSARLQRNDPPPDDQFPVHVDDRQMAIERAGREADGLDAVDATARLCLAWAVVDADRVDADAPSASRSTWSATVD